MNLVQHTNGIAVVGMACRFPGADNPTEFWQNLWRGECRISTFSDVEPCANDLAFEPQFVPKFGALQDVGQFDFDFFGYSPREASLIDPQQRIFLSTAWHALEDAGYAGPLTSRNVGVFGGTALNTYLLRCLLNSPEVTLDPNQYDLAIANDKDFLASRVCYKLDLRGPSVVVQSACSTSLVAVHLACQSLRAGECELALAGGVAVTLPSPRGYLYREGGVVANDGVCRAFDKNASGTVPGNGVGIVVLKRLADALADRDTIYAVLLGSAVRNDGHAKLGYTAPSAESQAAVISAAHATAGVSPHQVGYVEAHGTGTRLGDPVEASALARVFSSVSGMQCALGSVKTNIGHLDTAAGIAGLIKAILCVYRKKLVPSLHFKTLNPLIDFRSTPLSVNVDAREWEARSVPRIAGVSSFGMGGCNAHVVLAEGPDTPRSALDPRPRALVLSARTDRALRASARAIACALEQDMAPSLDDTAWTLASGRKRLTLRGAVVASNNAEAARELRRLSDGDVAVGKSSPHRVAFAFPGQGSQRIMMGASLHRSDPKFRADVDHCFNRLRDLTSLDMREILWSNSSSPLIATEHVQPCLFVIEYALAQLWIRWGIRPDAVIGHSVGEIAAASVAGILTLDDALRMVAFRGELMARAPSGAMLAIRSSELDILRRLPKTLDLAAVNGAHACVVAGPSDAIDEFGALIERENIRTNRLRVSGAYHSRMMDAAASELVTFMRRIKLRAPSTMWVSNCSGKAMSAAEATDPAYWGEQLRGAVRFHNGLQTLRAEQFDVLLEVGPGSTLTSLARNSDPPWTAVSTLAQRGRDVALEEPRAVQAAVAELYGLGIDVDWSAWNDRPTWRVSLPATPLDTTECLITPPMHRPLKSQSSAAATSRTEERPWDDRAEQESGVSTEERVLRAFRRVLGLPKLDPSEDFFAVGGHSLMASELALEVSRLVNRKVPPDSIYRAPTASALATLLTSETVPARSGLRDVDVERARTRVLDPTIKAIEATPPKRETQSFLLTGSTGFLGAFVLRELLDQTRAKIQCLVRASSLAEGMERVELTLGRYGVWRGDLRSRVSILLGDLSVPRLGLSDESFHALAREVDAVYHLGAWVHFTVPYMRLEPTNVGGTEELLRLAATETSKVVHFVSTAAVLPSREDGESAFESEPLQFPEKLDTSYALSKWTADRLATEAQTRGLAVAIYRPAVVSGDSRTGASNDSDFAVRMLRGCVDLGIAPRIESKAYVAPVDYVARAIVHISRNASCVGRTFHVVPEHRMSFTEVFERLRELGCNLRLLPYVDWRKEALDRVGVCPTHPIAPLLPLLSEDFFAAPTRLSSTNTQSLLEGSSIKFPKLESDLLRVYLNALTAHDESGEL